MTDPVSWPSPGGVTVAVWPTLIEGSLASGTGTVTVAAPSPTMVIPLEDVSLWPAVRPTEPTTPPMGAVRVEAARLVCASVRACSAAVMLAWSLRTFACFAAAAASVDRLPDPPLPEDPEDPEEAGLPELPEDPDEPDEPLWFDPEDPDEPVAVVVPALCCWASCSWTAVSAVAYPATAFWAADSAVDQACRAGTHAAICSGVTSYVVVGEAVDVVGDEVGEVVGDVVVGEAVDVVGDGRG